jgi:hypothetical protein
MKRLARLHTRSLLFLLACPLTCTAAFIPENQKRVETVTYHVSPQGDDAAEGSASHPFKSLERTQRAVRSANGRSNVVVELADGIYRVESPLVFRAVDGGQDNTSVLWQAAPDASPVIAGSVPVSGWTPYDVQKQIYVATIPVGADTRQVWVNDRLAKPASIEISRASVGFDGEGMMINDAAYDYLANLPAQDRMEVQSTGWFTNRISPVQAIVGRKLLMQQPAWDNNTWGYDTLHAPVGAETSHLFLNNSLAFLPSHGSSISIPERESCICDRKSTSCLSGWSSSYHDCSI